MASHLTMHPRTTCELPASDHALLHEALQHWHDNTVFTDEKVSQVMKFAFQRWLIETRWSKLDFVDCVMCLQSEPVGPIFLS